MAAPFTLCVLLATCFLCGDALSTQYHMLDIAQNCGKTITALPKADSGVISLHTELASKCLITLKAREGYGMKFALKSINTPDCVFSKIDIKSYQADVHSSSLVLSSDPYFCGSVKSFTEPMELDSEYDSTYTLEVSPGLDGSALTLELVYAIYAQGSDPVWPVIEMTSEAVLIAETKPNLRVITEFDSTTDASTTQYDTVVISEATTDLPSKEPTKTTFKPKGTTQDATPINVVSGSSKTEGPVSTTESTTVQPSTTVNDPTTTSNWVTSNRDVSTSQTSKIFSTRKTSTTPSTVKTTTTSTTKLPTTTGAATRPRPVVHSKKTRECECLVKYRIPLEDEYHTFSIEDINYSSLRNNKLDDAFCHDTYRCNSICRDYIEKHYPDGLESKRFSFGSETAGDHICSRINKPITRRMRVTVEAQQEDCENDASYVTTLDWGLCCTGRIHSYRKVDCSRITDDDIFG